MRELETDLNRILEEHQHESGLHVIGGRRRLIDRLVQFIQQAPPRLEDPQDSQLHN